MNTIHIPTPLRPFTDKKEAVEVSGGTVGELLADLTTRYEGLRKQRIRTAVYERRASMALALLGRFGGLEVEGLRPAMQWGPILPIDRSRQVADERALVEAGISSRRSAAARLGADDAQAEWQRIAEERED